MVYKNSQTKWIISLCFFILCTLSLSMFHTRLSTILYIIFNSIFLIGCLFTLLKILKNIRKMIKEIRTNNLKLQTIFETTDIAIWYHNIKKMNC